MYCLKCKSIIYSRSNRDYRSCDCGSVTVDGGFERTRTIFKDEKLFISIQLDGDKLLRQILAYDYNYRNDRAKDFPEGYCGKFILTSRSNKSFYSELITNGFEEVWKDLQDGLD